MSLKRNFCPMCGNEIIFTYGSIPIIYKVTELGEIQIEGNTTGDNYPVIEFFCSEDRTHELGHDESLIKWYDEVEQYFMDNECYHL